MGVFTRFRDIVSSNINSMLDNAEDPEKMIKMMVREIEDTLVELKASCAGVMAGRKKVQRQLALVELKASCAGVMAGRKKVQRQLDGIMSREKDWADKARLAVQKGRDDLAREALREKRRYAGKAESLNREIEEHTALVEQYQDDIRQLEEKLAKAREKQRMLVQRHIRARRRRRAQEGVRRADDVQAILRFDEIENRIERMEAEADLVNFGRKSSLEEEFDRLSLDDEIEKELQALKAAPLERKDER